MELKMLGLELKGHLEGEEKAIPTDFFSVFVIQNILDRWFGDPTPGTTVQNIQFLKKYETTDFLDHIFYGKFVEIALTQTINFMDLHGNETPIDVPPGKGQHSGFVFAVCPIKSLIVIENNRGVEHRLSSYLNFWLQKFWNPTRTDSNTKFDSITIRSIPIETNPINFIRGNSDLGSFEAILNAREFQRVDYGPFGRLFGNLGEEQKLKVKIEISTHRGGHLPEILTTNLAQLLEDISPSQNLDKVKVKKIVNGRKQSPLNLMNALEHKTVSIANDTVEDRKNALVDYLIELIEND